MPQKRGCRSELSKEIRTLRGVALRNPEDQQAKRELLRLLEIRDAYLIEEEKLVKRARAVVKLEDS